MKSWTTSGARRFLEGLAAMGQDDLPLFRGNADTAIMEVEDGVRFETVSEATLALWERLVRGAVSRRDLIPVELYVGQALLAIGAAGGPAMLAVRVRATSQWRVALAPEGVTARRIAARIPPGDGVERAA